MPEFPLTESIFLQAWWWEAVCPSRESRFFSVEGKAFWPLAERKRLGMFKVLAMPDLTQHAGPYLSERKYFIEIFDRIPNHVSLAFNLGFELDSEEIDYLESKGVSVLPCVTHRIEDCSDPEAVFARIKDSQKRQIRKALRTLHPTSTCRIEDLIVLQKETFARRGMKMPFSENTVRKLYNSVMAHGAGRLIGLEDGKGKIMAAGLFVYDRKVCYSLTHGFHKTATGMGAGSLLQWEGIRLASEKKLVFDFEGSNIESIARFNLSFGATEKKYHRLCRYSPLLAWSLRLRNSIFRGENP